MFKKIDLLLTDNQYNSTHLFTYQFKKALEALGVHCRLFKLDDGYLRDHFNAIVSHQPDLTCSFNYVGLENEGELFYDALQIPHLTYGLDAAIIGIKQLEKGRYHALSTVDRLDWKGFQSINNRHRLFFLPHAVDGLTGEEEEEEVRPYDLVFCGTYIDYEKEREQWPYLFPSSICSVIEHACDIVLSHSNSSVLMALFQASTSLNVELKSFNLGRIYYAVENYCKGKDRIELLQALSAFQIHVFGSQQTKEGWKKALKTLPHLVFHSPLSFEEVLQVYRKSKIVLNSSPQFKEGSHERVFYALQKGAAVVTNENAFLREQFNEDKGLLYYRSHQPEQLQEEVKRLLNHEADRKIVVQKGKNIVKLSHTWTNRAKELYHYWEGCQFEQNDQSTKCVERSWSTAGV